LYIEYEYKDSPTPLLSLSDWDISG
jgi:hypothetical protein